jgi:hypothetical protein
MALLQSVSVHIIFKPFKTTYKYLLFIVSSVEWILEFQ